MCSETVGAARVSSWMTAQSSSLSQMLRGSKIWTGEWKEQRAATYKTDDLEAHYRERSMLKLSVFPEDIAEAIYFLASDMSAKSTGNIINVDAGNAQSFTR